jgi:hypothetical protein
MNVLSFLAHRPVVLLAGLLSAIFLAMTTGCRDSILPPGVDARPSHSDNVESVPDPSPTRDAIPVDPVGSSPKKRRDQPLKRPSPGAGAEQVRDAEPNGARVENPEPSRVRDSKIPPPQVPLHPLGNIVLAPELPAGFTTEVHDLTEKGKAKGVDIAGTAVLVYSPQIKAQGRAAAVTITLEDRMLPDKDYKITAYKAYVNGAVDSWRNQGFRVERHAVPDPSAIDPDKRTRTRFTFVKNGQRIEVENLISFTDRGLLVSVMADHDDDFQMLSKWADSIRPK